MGIGIKDESNINENHSHIRFDCFWFEYLQNINVCISLLGEKLIIIWLKVLSNKNIIKSLNFWKLCLYILSIKIEFIPYFMCDFF